MKDRRGRTWRSKETRISFEYVNKWCECRGAYLWTPAETVEAAIREERRMVFMLGGSCKGDG
jgi:hypothetical protein